MTPRPPEPIPTPKHISKRVRAVCSSILPQARPIVLPCRPEPYAEAGACHANVAEKVRREGGSVQHGWIVYEIPPWEICAEFHAVWRSDAGCLVDVTPALHGGSRVLFLPDARRTYEGRNIAGVHYPYSDTSICREYAELATAQERILYPPGEIYVNGRAVDPKQQKLVTERMVNIFMRASYFQ